MRLLENEVLIIKQSVQKYIKNAKVVLFGSRVYDHKKGGDIDIYVETDKKVDLSTQIKILTDIEMSGLMRKVDLIVKTPISKHNPIFSVAQKEGIVL